MAGQSLSKNSEYEQMFRTRHRAPGRPADGDGEVLFPSGDNHPLLVRLAERRAFAVVHAENRERLSSLFKSELKVLKARGLEQVAEDSNTDIEQIIEDRKGAVTRASVATGTR